MEFENQEMLEEALWNEEEWEETLDEDEDADWDEDEDADPEEVMEADWEESEEVEEQQEGFEAFSVREELTEQMLPEELQLVHRAQDIIRKQEQQEADRFMEKEFLALQREFPDCGLQEVGQLLETAAGKKALELWKSVDIPLADAYAATHRMEIQTRQNAAIRQGILNQMNGKRHLTPVRSAQKRMEMPADVRAEFKKYFPDASDREIEKMYHKNKQQE